MHGSFWLSFCNNQYLSIREAIFKKKFSECNEKMSVDDKNFLKNNEYQSLFVGYLLLFF